MSKKLKTIVSLAKRGMKILPLAPQGKTPTCQGGVHAATDSVKELKKYFHQHRDANYGIATGKASNVVVVDVDGKEGQKSLRALEAVHGDLPETVTVETGEGLHFYFRPGDLTIRNSVGRIGEGVDIRGEGGYVVGPGSTHASGAPYKFAADREIREVEIAEVPTWLGTLVKNAASPPPKATDSSVVEGGRNEALTSLAGTMRRGGASADAILAALLAENKTRCSPPLDESEVEKIVKSVTRYAPAPVNQRADDAEKLMHIVLNDYFHAGSHLNFGTDGQFWHYSGKVWAPVSNRWVEGRILESIKAGSLNTSQRSASLMKQVRSLLEAQLAARGDPLGFVSDPPRVINCVNGEVWIADVGTIELRPHRPKSYLRHLLDVSYDPGAKCPRYDKALLEIFSKARKPKVLRRHWHELVGYLIQPHRNIPLIAVLLGAGANGKTVLARTIVKLIGQAQVHAQRVEELDKNRFALGSLLGKLVFLDDDVRAGARLPDGTLKMISEAKEVTGEHKYKPPFNFVVRTVPMLLCNNVPSLADVSYGMMRRLMVIPFDRTFSDQEKDDGLFERIWQHELPGVLNKALDGYVRLLNRRRFKTPRAVVKATQRWLEQANPVPAFISECCVVKPTAKCQMRHLYPAYKMWATEAGFTMIQNQLSFRRNLEHLGYKKLRSTGGFQAIAGLDLKK